MATNPLLKSENKTKQNNTATTVFIHSTELQKAYDIDQSDWKSKGGG